MARPVATEPGATGDPLDFETVFEQELGYVVHTLRRLGVREADVEDVAHDVFITVQRLLPTFEQSRPLRPWLFGIALRAAQNYRRRVVRRGEVTTDEFGDTADDAPGADAHLEVKQARGLVLEALEALDDDRRAVFILHDLDGRPVPEIAEALSIPLNTAYARLRLAREQFTAAVRRLQLRRGER
jgi:RNA polymerase sigma-70 factor (ECF subfamily)